MKIKPLRQQVVAPVILLLLLGMASSCSFNARSSAGNVSSPSPETTPVSQNKSPLPRSTGFVTDYSGVFDSEAKSRLESTLIELREKSAIEFAILTIQTTGEQPIFDYSLAVAKGWGVGPKDTSKGGGLVLVLATEDRKWRIQVSRNLEKDLPDEVCKELGEASHDLYQQGKTEEGIIKFVKAIIERLEKVRGFKLDNEL